MHPIDSPVGRTELQPGGFLAFMPKTLPPDLPALDAQVVASLGDANRAIAHLAGKTGAIANVGLFVSMYVHKEALLSAAIENIECTLDDIFEVEQSDGEGPADEMRDVNEVVNYVRALNAGIEGVGQGQAINLGFIRAMHAILMRSGRGADMEPGNFRSRQNWIGPKGSSAANATYVPPPVDRMQLALGNLAYYINEHQGHDPIVRCAVAHAQFETIHPFLDGNGRMGRLLILLMLKREKVLDTPLLYPSLYLAANRTEYFDRLMSVREKGDWAGWIRFFARALEYSANDALLLTNRIIDLEAKSSAKVEKMPASVRKLLPELFRMPLMSARLAQARIASTFDTAADALKRLEDAGLLIEVTGRQRGKLYRFSPYIEILEGAGDNEPHLGVSRRLRQ